MIYILTIYEKISGKSKEFSGIALTNILKSKYITVLSDNTCVLCSYYYKICCGLYSTNPKIYRDSCVVLEIEHMTSTYYDIIYNAVNNLVNPEIEIYYSEMMEDRKFKLNSGKHLKSDESYEFGDSRYVDNNRIVDGQCNYIEDHHDLVECARELLESNYYPELYELCMTKLEMGLAVLPCSHAYWSCWNTFHNMLSYMYLKESNYALKLRNGDTTPFQFIKASKIEKLIKYTNFTKDVTVRKNFIPLDISHFHTTNEIFSRPLKHVNLSFFVPMFNKYFGKIFEDFDWSDVYATGSTITKIVTNHNTHNTDIDLLCTKDSFFRTVCFFEKFATSVSIKYSFSISKHNKFRVLDIIKSDIPILRKLHAINNILRKYLKQVNRVIIKIDTIELDIFINSPNDIVNYHVPVVRAYFDGTDLMLTPSFICSVVSGICVDYRRFIGLSNPMNIILRKMDQGHAFVVNKSELQCIASTAEVEGFIGKDQLKTYF